MESAPQSTITHNAVIEFASDLFLFPTPRRSPRERRAHKKKAHPAQKGGLKSVGTLPKSYLRRNAAKGVNGRFEPCICFETGAFRQNSRNGYRTGAGGLSLCPARPRILGAMYRR